jgi:hypothetical protein
MSTARKEACIPSSDFIQRTCPACGTQGTGAPDVVAAERAEDMSYADLKLRWQLASPARPFFSYYRCSRCALLHCQTYFGDAQLAELYGVFSDNTQGLPHDTIAKTQRGYFDVLARYSSRRGSVLEIGPDIGLFTQACREQGQFDHYWLFEPNRAAHAELEQRVSGSSYVLSTEMLRYDAVPERSVSVASMIHVLDHLRTPLETLRAVHALLRDDGYILIVTHDESSLMPRFVGRRWPGYCVYHPQLFRADSMTNLLRAAGFDVVTIEKTINYFPLSHLTRQFLWMIGAAALPVPPLPAIALGLPLGNIITIARRRAA